MRIYLPLTLGTLAEAYDAGEVAEDAERFTAEDDSEEAEYAALMTAAGASAELSDGPGRRVVLVAEVAGPAAAVPRTTWAAVHVDTDEGASAEDDLAWFATQEIGDLIASL